MQSFKDFLTEKLWSGDVDTHWKPPADLFTKSGKEIASVLLAAGKGKAMKRLNFYINRAGSKLSGDDMSRLNAAKEIIMKATHKED